MRLRMIVVDGNFAERKGRKYARKGFDVVAVVEDTDSTDGRRAFAAGAVVVVARDRLDLLPAIARACSDAVPSATPVQAKRARRRP